jgi:hypothetical protein
LANAAANQVVAIAISNVENVVARATEKPVKVRWIAIDGTVDVSHVVVASLAVKMVVASASDEQIFLVAAADHVFASPVSHPVPASPGDDVVRLGGAADFVSLIGALAGIVYGTAGRAGNVPCSSDSCHRCQEQRSHHHR